MAGKERLELTTCGFGDRCSSQLSYFPVNFNRFPTLLGFPVERVLTLELAILDLLKTSGSIAFFLGRRIVAPLALGAFQNNQFAHVQNSFR